MAPRSLLRFAVEVAQPPAVQLPPADGTPRSPPLRLVIRGFTRGAAAAVLGGALLPRLGTSPANLSPLLGMLLERGCPGREDEDGCARLLSPRLQLSTVAAAGAAATAALFSFPTGTRRSPCVAALLGWKSCSGADSSGSLLSAMPTHAGRGGGGVSPGPAAELTPFARRRPYPAAAGTEREGPAAGGGTVEDRGCLETCMFSRDRERSGRCCDRPCRRACSRFCIVLEGKGRSGVHYKRTASRG